MLVGPGSALLIGGTQGLELTRHRANSDTHKKPTLREDVDAGELLGQDHRDALG